MNWLNIIIGIVLIFLGLNWLSYELDRRKKLKRQNEKFQLAFQPKYFLGVYILIISGIFLILRSLFN